MCIDRAAEPFVLAFLSLRDELFLRIREMRKAELEQQWGLWAYPFLSRAEVPLTTFSIETFLRLWDLESDIKSVNGLADRILHMLRKGVQKFWNVLRAKTTTARDSGSRASAGMGATTPKRSTAMWEAAYAEFIGLQQNTIGDLLHLCSRYGERSRMRVERWQMERPSTQIAVIQEAHDQRKSLVDAERQKTVCKLEHEQQMKRKISFSYLWNSVEDGENVISQHQGIDEENVVRNLARLHGNADVGSGEPIELAGAQPNAFGTKSAQKIIFMRSQTKCPLADISASFSTHIRASRAPVQCKAVEPTAAQANSSRTSRMCVAEVSKESPKRKRKTKTKTKSKKKKAKEKDATPQMSGVKQEEQIRNLQAAVVIQAYVRAYLSRVRFQKERRLWKTAFNTENEPGPNRCSARNIEIDATVAKRCVLGDSADVKERNSGGRKKAKTHGQTPEKVKPKSRRELWKSFIPAERHRDELAQLRMGYEKRIKVLERRLKDESKRRKIALAKADERAQLQFAKMQRSSEALQEQIVFAEQKLKHHKVAVCCAKKQSKKREVAMQRQLHEVSAALTKLREEGGAASERSAQLEEHLGVAHQQVAVASARTAALEHDLAMVRQQLDLVSSRSSVLERDLEATRSNLEAAAANNAASKSDALAAKDAMNAVRHEAALQFQNERAKLRRVDAKREMLKEELECLKALLARSLEDTAAKDTLISTLKSERRCALDSLASAKCDATSYAEDSRAKIIRLEQQRNRLVKAIQRMGDLRTVADNFVAWKHEHLQAQIKELQGTIHAERQRAAIAIAEATTAHCTLEQKLRDANAQLASSIDAARAATTMAFEFDAVTRSQEREIRRLRDLV